MAPRHVAQWLSYAANPLLLVVALGVAARSVGAPYQFALLLTAFVLGGASLAALRLTLCAHRAELNLSVPPGRTLRATTAAGGASILLLAAVLGAVLPSAPSYSLAVAYLAAVGCINVLSASLPAPRRAAQPGVEPD